MKPVKLFLLFLSIIILNNCSHHKVKIDAAASSDQMTDYRGVVTSEKKHAVSLAYLELGMLNDRTKFMIIVENYGDKPVVFSNDNISVMFEGNSIDWSSKKIEVETPSDVMKDIQKEIIRQTTFSRRSVNTSGFTDVFPSSSAGASRGGSRASLFSELMPDGGDDGTGAAAVAMMKEFRMTVLAIRMENIGIMRAQSFHAIPRVIIQPQIIMPNESVSGIFICDTSKMKNKLQGEFKITVTIDGEKHKFTFTRRLI